MVRWIFADKGDWLRGWPVAIGHKAKKNSILTVVLAFLLCRWAPSQQILPHFGGLKYFFKFLWNQGRLTKLRESARFPPCIFQLNWLARKKRLDNHVLSRFVVKRKRYAFFGIEVVFVDFTKSPVFLFRVTFSRSFYNKKQIKKLKINSI